MKFNLPEITDKAFHSILSAIGTPADCVALMLVLSPLAKVAKKWRGTTERTREWALKLVELASLINEECQGSDAKRIYFGTPKLEAGLTYISINEIFSCDAVAWEREPLDELLLCCVCISAGNGFVLQEGVAVGLLNCYRSLANGRLKGWLSIAENPPKNLEEIEQHIGSGRFGQSQLQFLRQLYELMRHQITHAPADLLTDNGAIALQSNDIASDKPIQAQSEEQVVEPQQEPCSRHPLSMAAKIAASTYASWSAKAGVDRRREQIPSAELKLICRSLASQLTDGDLVNRRHAILALVCVLFGVSEAAALDLHVGPPPDEFDADQWFDPSTGCHVWNHSVYLVGEAGRSNHELLNCIPLPRIFTEALQNIGGPYINGKQIKHILFSGTTYDPVEFGQYLLSVSSEAHPATSARLAKSFGNAFLQCTRSDIGAAYCSLNLSLVGSASLDYFSPSRNWVHQKCAEVFDSLGLGDPVPTIGIDSRMGVRRIPLSLDLVQSGWSQLEDCVISAYRDVLKWQSREAAATTFNRLSVLTATALIGSIGGRTSRPDRTLVSHLYSSDRIYAFADKDVKETGLWRLLPHTAFSLALLKLYRHARSYCLGRLGIDDKSGMIASSPAFISIDIANLAIEAISTEDIKNCIQEIFGEVPANFFRHLLFTTWVEAGRDRWLLRCWTGHGRVGVMPFDAPMAVAPRHAMETLATELNDHLSNTLGSWDRVNKLAAQLNATKIAQFASPRYEWLDVSPRGAKLNDHGWPEKISPRVVLDWELVNRIQQRIALADFDKRHVGLVVSKVAIDGLPLPLALKGERGKDALCVGKLEGDLWERDHDVNPAFIARLPPTRLILGQPQIGVGTERLIRDVAAWLRQTDRTSAWPTDDQACVERFEAACLSWRRIELPPALSLSSSPNYESCSASLHSLMRLSGFEENVSRLSSIGLTLPKLSTSTRQKIHNLSVFNSILNRCSDSKVELGRDIARARELVKSLDGLTRGTYVFELAKQYLFWEANAVIDGATHQNAISSLATRWTALRPALDQLDLFTCSDDINDGLLLRVTEEVIRYCGERQDKKSSSQSDVGAGQVRAKDALQRFFRMLQASGTTVPVECWSLIGGSKSSVKRRSAGSSLVLKSNVTTLTESIRMGFSDRNVEQQFLLTKLGILVDVPSRTGEVGSTLRNCLTLCGDLIFFPTGFATDKTKHAVRLAEIAIATREQIEKFSTLGREIRADGKYLFRFDEHAQALDFAANQFIEDELKRHTQDEYCRLHSLRSMAYCNRAWPGWEQVARSFLTGDLTPEEALRWTKSISVYERWTMLIDAAEATGHGSIDAALKSYLSIWNLLHSIYLYATLIPFKPATSFWLECAKVKPEAMRKAMYRAKSNDLGNGWLYLVNRLESSNAEPALRLVELLTQQVPSKPIKQAPIKAVSRLQYLMLRMLAVSADRARHELRLPMGIEDWAADLLPDADKVQQSRKRKRAAAGAIGLGGEVKMLLSDTGTALTNWIVGLTPSQCEWLQVLLMRWDQRLPGRLEATWDPQFWQGLVHGMPSDICLQARFGKGAHLPIGVEANLKQEVACFKLGERMEGIGKMPDVVVRYANKESRSGQARLTALTKIAVMACLAIASADNKSSKALYD